VVTESPFGPPGSTAGANGTVAGSHVYADNGTYTVTVCVTDKDGAQTCDTLTVVAKNVPPTVIAGADQTVNEGDVVSLDPATFNDLGTLDTHTATIDWGDGTPIVPGTVTESPFGPPGSTAGADGTVAGQHVYGDAGTYTVTVCVTDKDGAQTCDTLTVTAENVPPSVSATPATATVTSSDVHDIQATFTDPGFLDTHTAVVDWGDGTSEPVSVTENHGAGSLSAEHRYWYPGTYTINVTVTDGDTGVTDVVTDTDGAATTSTIQVVVLGPQDLMRSAIDLLTPFKGDHRISKAIDEVNQGLDAKLWTDEIHLDGEHGQTVFDRDRHATGELMKALGKPVAPENEDHGKRDEHGPQPLSAQARDAVTQALQLLTNANWSLAHVAVLEAHAAPTTGVKSEKLREFQKDLAKADAEFASANDQSTAGRYDRAIEGYGSAWKTAVEALKEIQPKPSHPDEHHPPEPGHSRH
jgi:PKD repeat protein